MVPFTYNLAMRIDLHGMYEDEAIMAIHGALISFEFSNHETMEIITGNGYVLKDVAIEEILDYGYSYYVAPGNNGTIIVTK